MTATATTPNVADFYAGISQATFQMDVQSELASCMEQSDSELGSLWQKALGNLAAGNEEQWERYFSMAQMLSQVELQPCAQSSEELLDLGAQLEMWWGGFWSKPDSHKTVESNYATNKAEIDTLVSNTVALWDNSDFYGAGEAFGEFWTLLMGKPTWQEGQIPQGEGGRPTEDGATVENLESASKHPLADFYGSGLTELWNEEWTEEISQCLVFDELAIISWDFALQSLYPYDEFNWTKYFYAIGVLDAFNWGPCMENAGLKELTDKNSKWWNDFWQQENAQQIMEENIRQNEEAVGVAVLALQSSWKYGDYTNAGKAYADFWGLLMGRPELTENAEPKSFDK